MGEVSLFSLEDLDIKCCEIFTVRSAKTAPSNTKSANSRSHHRNMSFIQLTALSQHNAFFKLKNHAKTKLVLLLSIYKSHISSINTHVSQSFCFIPVASWCIAYKSVKCTSITVHASQPNAIKINIIKNIICICAALSWYATSPLVVALFQNDWVCFPCILNTVCL